MITMKPIKVVITGGPSGGKTTLIEGLQKELGPEVLVVPEAATILYRGGFPRASSKSTQCHVQKAIYHTQKELEELLYEEHGRGKRLVVCDRGSLDGVAYWPGSEADFFSALDTSSKKEISRYDWVLHLNTAAKPFYDTNNPIRTESYEEAIRLNEKIKRAWRRHPRRLIIDNSQDFFSKMALAIAVIRAILAGRTAEEIRSEMLLD
ncbi:MAG: ATP-binding protein [Bdellovibrionaceae bacterium]|nr:ATP-binding protein [Pseudobdellovibrionaceae bacterium]